MFRNRITNSVTRFALLVIGIALVRWVPAWGSEQGLFSVCEPIRLPNSIDVADVPVISYQGSRYPALELGFMALANCIRVEGLPSGEDRNVVSLAHISIAVSADPRWASRIFVAGDTVDTVTVVIDFRSMRRVEDHTAEEVIAATMECVHRNAARSDPAIRYLRTIVKGPKPTQVARTVHRVNGFRVKPGPNRF